MANRKMTSLSEKLAGQGFEIIDGTVVACNGIGFKNLLHAGRRWLEVQVDFVNGLNVFPVPDGDTGTNMLLTMCSALEQIKQAPNHDDLGTIAQLAAQGALMGARGNSGVILSQFLQGLARNLQGLVTFRAEDFVRAARLGVDQAYDSVVSPVEGTILTVAREAAEVAQQSAKDSDDLITLLTDMVTAAKFALANTPELLPILKEAGVPDAGGQGLVYILEGGLRFMNDEPVDVPSVRKTAPPLKSNLGVDEEAYGYDVQFLIQGNNLNVVEIQTRIDSLGWSTVVVGDERLVKVHVHTCDPGLPISYGANQGLISDVIVENLEEQAKAFVQDQAITSVNGASLGAVTTVQLGESGGTITEVNTLAVVPGDGLAQIFQSLGVSRIVFSRPTMNPSAQELLDAISMAKADKVLVLPNNDALILAAQQAERLSEKRVAVIPTRTAPQGIAALLSFNYLADIETNARRMCDAAQQVQTIEVTRAVRDSTFNGRRIKAGDGMGFLDNELMGVGQDYDEAVLDILANLATETYEIFTIYFGQESSRAQTEVLAAKIGRLYPDLEIEIYYGGQPNYYYIISLE